jgi:diketogulonate reductase-like aldo/keto reductase
VEPLLAAIEYGVCLIVTAEEYGTEEIAGKAIEGQRDGVFPAACSLGISRGATQLQQQNEAFGDLAQIITVSIINSIGPIPQFQSKSQ